MPSEPHLDLCVGTYRVLRAFGNVVVFATGLHRTSGFLAYLVREPGDDFPPRFTLWHVRSDQPTLYIVTPFATSISFQTTRDLQHVEIRDATGLNLTAVEDLAKSALMHAT